MKKNPFIIGLFAIAAVFVAWIWYFGVRTAPEEPQTESLMPPEKKMFVQAIQNSEGKYHLADERGYTLYTTTKDGPNQSNCYDACAKAWPPLLASKENVKPANDVSGKLVVVDRKDGTKQYAYIDQPLYYYEGDKETGDMKGNGIGGIWFAAKP